MDPINKQVLTIMSVGAVTLCALAMLGNSFDRKAAEKQKKENMQIARATRVERSKEKEYFEIKLDMDKHPKTTEAIVKVAYEEEVPFEIVQQIVSNRPDRTVWEWKKWGLFLKVDPKEK